ncbi:MAG: hypothetical protein ACOYYS_23340 [Chloroflexota bacterium]
MKAKLKRIFGGIAIVLLVLVLGYLVIRPLHLNWGTASEDVARAMPGDLDGARWTRAITIEATPEQIWPWLVQWGQGRGGWYSYDWLENLFGFDIHTADHIVPEYQDLKLGDPICMAANMCVSFVSAIEPFQWFGWQSKDDAGKPFWTFMIGLFPLDKTHTRLVIRESFDAAMMPPVAAFVLEIPDVVMELKTLDTLKQRAEGHSASGWVTAYEIGIWLTAFVISLVAGVLFITRQDWRKPLAVCVAGIMILLILTFLFPPLGVRGVLVAGLLAGLVWDLRQTNEVQLQESHS